MEELYRSQDLDAMASMLNDAEITSGENKDLLLDQRNRNWVVKLKELMKDKSLFVAVGAGHLPGNQGVLELLRKEGYKVKPLLNKN